jgi:hypothetical protein
MTARKSKTEVEVLEPDEKLDSSGPKPSAEPISPAAITREDLDLPGGVRSGNVPIVPSSDPDAPLGRDDEGRPIRKMKSDREILSDLRRTDRAKKDNKGLCQHHNAIETCSYGCGTERVPTFSPPPKSKPPEKNRPLMKTVAQLSDEWIHKPKGKIIPKLERKITREALGITPIQILEWLDSLVDVDIVTQCDLRPVLKPAPFASCTDLEEELTAAEIDLQIRTQQHRDLTAAGQKRAAKMGQAPFDPKRRAEFMQVAYRAKIAATKRIREIQEQIRKRKKESADWGNDINHWTVEIIPESKHEVAVEHRLRDHSPHAAAKYRDFVELRNTWEDDPNLWIPIHPAGHIPQEYFYTGGVRRVDYERSVILCAYLLKWWEPPPGVVRKFPKLRELEPKRIGTMDWASDPDTDAEDIGAEETQSILKDGGVSARMTIHGDTWKRLKTFETFARMAHGPDGADGNGFYGGMDYDGEEE